METIKNVSIVEQHNEDSITYAVYTARKRVIPDVRDGLKPVHRRILYAMFKDEKAFRYEGNGNGKVKTATVIGTTIGRYHPHGDAGVGEAIKPMVNWFEIKQPLIDGDSFGDPLGFRMSSPRYTEIKISDYAMECIISELKNTPNAVDWEPNFSDTLKEPVYFPAAVPNLLINGAYGIASGLSVDIPRHNLNEVIDATINLIHNPNYKVVLIPDNCMETDIVNTDWKKISMTGRGTYKVRARVKITTYEGYPALLVTSVPDLVFFNKISETIEKMVKDGQLPQVHDIVDLSGDNDKTGRTVMQVYIVLKKNCDPNYIKDLLFSKTPLEKVRSVNFEVLVNDNPVLMNYTDYLKSFLQFRVSTKYRLYANLLKELKTQHHRLALYIKALESGEIDNIIKMIRKQKTTDDHEYIEYLIKKLNVTDVQARFLLNTDIRKLSKGYLAKYKEEFNKCEEKANVCMNYLSDQNLILAEIEKELIYYKEKYGSPRMSRVINGAMDDIPNVEFKVVITNGNCIKKMEANDNIGSLGGDTIKYVMNVMNQDNLIIFSTKGRAFKLPVYKIPFGKKGFPGTDIRMIIKKLTSDICGVTTESFIKKFEQWNLVVLTKGNYIKRIATQDLLGASPSGIIYTKLEEGDSVVSIMAEYPNIDIVVLSKNKALRIDGSDIPLTKRAARGCMAMKTTMPMTSMSVVDPKYDRIVVYTSSGYINKIDLNALPISKRGRAGNSLIKMDKNDEFRIVICSDSSKLSVITKNGISEISASELPLSSSASKGKKMFSNIISIYQSGVEIR